MSTTKLSVYEKLMRVQYELKAPKGQYNSFGKYHYRNCEDILEAVKPINLKYGALVLLSDRVVMVGERYYIEATATFVDAETGDSVSVSASAREEDSKKGMDGSQVSGASSSYARKYALNGLYDIDDTKDSDTTNTHGKEVKDEPSAPNPVFGAPQFETIDTPRSRFLAKLKEKGIDAKAFAKEKGLDKNTTDERYEELIKELG